MEINYLTLFITNFIFFFILYFILLKISYKIKLLDISNNRKIHQGMIPLVGGPLIFISCILVVLLFDVKFDNLFFYVFFSSFILISLGVYDDIYSVSPYIRLLIQVIAISFIINAGINISHLYSQNIYLELNIFGYIFTLLCLIALINSFNFIDGIDGLASSSFLVPIFSIFIFYLINNENFNLYIILFFNVFLFFFVNIKVFKFNQIFLGDSGSTFLGFILGCILIYSSENMLIDSFLVPWLVLVPIYDLIRVIIIRIAKKTNPIYPDKIHIHHILMNVFNSQFKALLLINILSILSIILGYFLIKFLGFYSILIYLLIFIMYFYIINKIMVRN